MRIVDMSASARQRQYEYFLSMDNPHVSLTVNCDISHLLEVTEARKLPFFLTLLHCVVNAANAVPELRQRIRGDEVVEYENCLSSHTVALPDDSYCYCPLDCSMPLEEFLPYAKEAVERAKLADSLDDGEDSEKLYFVTSVPWFSFAALHVPTKSSRDSIPRISFGKYFTQEGKTLLPLHLQVHHGLVDGVHIARFYEGVERRIREL